MTPEERDLPRFTRHYLCQLDTWPLWEKAEQKQMDQFWTLPMWGDPCNLTPSPLATSSQN
jgi:hypothetical protein